MVEFGDSKLPPIWQFGLQNKTVLSWQRKAVGILESQESLFKTVGLNYYFSQQSMIALVPTLTL